MNISYFAITMQQKQTAMAMQSILGGKLYPCTDLRDELKEAFLSSDAMVCVMAAGIVVRMIGPLLGRKDTDPAVIVTDPYGKFIISLLSGHLGGANDLARQLANITGGYPIITTATDNEGIRAFDLIAKENDLKIENLSALKYISAAELDKKDVNVVIDPFYLNENAKKTLYLRPAALCLGVGCKRNTDPQLLMQAFEDFSNSHQIDPELIVNIATISLKAGEEAIHQLAMSLGIALTIIPDQMIRELDFERVSGGPIQHSDFVEKMTGVGSVAEACAYLGACQAAKSRYKSKDLQTNGRVRLRIKKVKYQGITFALAEYGKQVMF